MLLYRLAELMLEKETHVLPVDDLFDDEQIGVFVKSIQIDSPYQQMLYEGVLTETVKDEQLRVTFTVEGFFHFILGEVIYDLSDGKDVNFLINLLNNSKLNGTKEGIEQCLIRDIIGNQFERLINFIDSGGDYLEICIRPLLYFIKSYGVETALEKLLKNPTPNDWQALLQLNELLSELQLQVLRKELLNNVINRISFYSKYDTILGLEAIAVIDDDLARIYHTQIDLKADFIQNDSQILESLGSCFDRFGEYDKALEYHEKCLAFRLKTLKKEHPHVANSCCNIGEVWHHKGLYDNALEYYHKCLVIQLKSFGEEHPSVASSYNNIGAALDSKGLYDNALEYYNKCLSIRLKTLGKEHPSVATSYNNIGVAWKNKGVYDKELEYQEKCLAVRLKILGEEHPYVAQSYNNIGFAWNNKRVYAKALEYYEKCLSIQLKTLGWEHPSVSTTYNNIGFSWSSKGDYDKALEYYEKCLAIRLKTLGEDHPNVAESYNNIGFAWKNKGVYNIALEYHEKCLGIQLRTLKEEHPSVAITYNNIGGVLINIGNYDKSFEYSQKSLEIFLATLSYDHPYISFPYKNIGLAWRELGDYNKALDYFQKSMEIRLNKFGIIDSRTKESIGYVKEMYEKLNKKNEMPDWMNET